MISSGLPGTFSHPSPSFCRPKNTMAGANETITRWVHNGNGMRDSMGQTGRRRRRIASSEVSDDRDTT
ncbi:hypothetical protein CY34DRAFT_810387 [Suillus luteus UH-Slu-Lm8-n1]|uniref:Uncharacterized protein n=1 Tax=Suillus luteus UH-Slu-Lm8-n1 TaxID=930992 RepID=A0A0C9ZIZ4_9AGAM|nr:hypothetical protein CY34DRAFT_810387 [Suillus luteus UH-Slu-Lm8-n1]